MENYNFNDPKDNLNIQKSELININEELIL
jgi:hypothetical protein